jgi:branched-chain amino acid transport system substrate-binding protein
MMKKRFEQLFVWFLALGFLAGFCGIAVAAEEIKVGGIMDTTGATSDVGKDYAIGMEDAFKYINEQGGVNGKPIKYTWFDYGYRIPEAITKYKLLKRLGVVAIMGWGTGDPTISSSRRTIPPTPGLV